MAGPQLADTFDTSEAIGQREDLSDIIVQLEPQDTPFYSRGRRSTSSAVLTEWQTQELEAPADNAQPEGGEFVPQAVTPTERLTNVHQIATKEINISGTLEQVDKAGRDSEMAYQKVLKGIELKRDVERALLANNPKKSTDPRETAGMPTWITGDRFYEGATGVKPTGDGTDGYTKGTLEAMSLPVIDDILEAVYKEGGITSYFLLGTRQRRNFSALVLGSSTLVQNQLEMTQARPASGIATVSIYLSDFAQHDVVMGRYLDVNSMFFIDERHYEVCALPGRNFTVIPLARTGDAEKYMEVVEFALKVNAPKAHGLAVAFSE